MRTVSQQIGWTQEAKLLYEIQRELDYLYNTTWNVVVNPTTTTTTTYFCTDADVIIGTQTWKLCNLNVDHYRNGDIIPQVTDPTEWESLRTGAWCWYNNDPALGAIYGKLYNWYAVNDPRGLAPIGYHIPSDTEWNTLVTDLGGDSQTVGGLLKETGFIHWNSPNIGATNSSGFTALPGGNYIYTGTQEFISIGNNGIFWSSNEDTIIHAGGYILFYDREIIDRYSYYKFSGLSVRLIKD